MGTRAKIEKLIQAHQDDRELAIALMDLASEDWGVGGEVGFWGPLLYRRNRAVFLPLIERHVNPWSLGKAKGLDRWMDEAEANGDRRLWRIMYQAWLNDQHGWQGSQKVWREDFVAAFAAAPDRGRRREVVEKYDLWFEITDDHAQELYAIDPVVAREFLLNRFRRADWFDGDYRGLARVAQTAGDTDFYFELYRLSFPPDVWAKDVQKLAETVTDARTLCAELDRRHPEGPDAAADPGTLLSLFEKRGADVLPYLERRVPDVLAWNQEKTWEKFASLALDRGFTTLWATLVKTQFTPQGFGQLVIDLCQSGRPDWERAARLVQIAGAQYGWREWRSLIGLNEDAALALYRTFPEICRESYATHLKVSQMTPYLALAQAAEATGDPDMIDTLAAAAVMVSPGWYDRGSMANLDWYVAHYRALDDATFARRALEVLSRAQSPEPYGKGKVRTENPLYPVFFEDVRRYRAILPHVRDLLEAPSEPARRVGLRLLEGRDPETVAAAARNTDHLAAYLIGRAERSTRIAAFNALAAAASSSEVTARAVLARAREALELRQRAYPRERLIELIGRILHRWPSLRLAQEQPLVHGVEASW